MNIVEEFNLDPDDFVWQDLSMCANIPTEAFFDDADSDEAIANAAKAVCAYCPVREMCQKFAEENKAYGIYAGRKYEKGKIVD